MLLSAFAFSVMSLLVKAVGERLPAQEIVFAWVLTFPVVALLGAATYFLLSLAT